MRDKDKGKSTKDNIREALENKLATEALDVGVEIRDSEVILTGVVDDLADKMAAEDAVWGINGVRRVENNMTIAMDGTITDDDIMYHAESTLQAHHLPVVNIEVNHGRIDLSGKVQDLKQAKEIEGCLQSVQGVAAIYNHLSPEHGAYSDDATIVNEIERTLVGVGLSAPDIDVYCVEGEVQLSGYVNNPNERSLAEDIVSGVHGVQKVVNRLAIRR